METVAKTRTKANKEHELVNDGDKAWVTMSQVVNLGDYENVRIEVGYSRTIKTTDQPIDVINQMEEELEDLLVRKVEEIKGVNETPKRRRKR
jgi:hypothetical protein